MSTELLTIGPPHAIAQTTVYAMPARSCYLLATTAVELSVDASTGFALVAASTTGIVTAAQFVRCTTGASILSVKAA